MPAQRRGLAFGCARLPGVCLIVSDFTILSNLKNLIKENPLYILDANIFLNNLWPNFPLNLSFIDFCRISLDHRRLPMGPGEFVERENPVHVGRNGPRQIQFIRYAQFVWLGRNGGHPARIG